MKVLLIGGRADGMRMDIPENRSIHPVFVPGTEGDPEDYQEIILRIGERDFHLFTYSEITPEQAMEMLISKYPKETVG